MKRIINLWVILLSIAVLAGCTKGLEELNRDPNRITLGGIEPANMIEPILITGSNALLSDMAMYASEIAQASSKGGNVREEQAYVMDNAIYEGRWNLFYRWATNADHLAKLATEQNDPNYHAIGLIMKVYYLSQCTDMFGSIAYTEALKILDNIFTPRIESQQEVYTAMMADLGAANAMIDLTKLLPKAQRDHLYNGNMANWKKFANTLHLRLLMRISGRNDAFSPTIAQRIKTIIDDPATYPVFTSNVDNAAVKFDASAIYYRNYFNKVDYPSQSEFTSQGRLSIPFLNLTVYDFESGACDPRLKIWGRPVVANNYKWRGAIPGGSKNVDNLQGSKYSIRQWETLVRDDNSNMLMDYAELLFIKSEAAFLGWIGGNPQEYYEAAVTASCQRWNELGKYAKFPINSFGDTAPVNITAGDIVAMLAQPKTMYDGTLERIQTQKWVALFWVVGYEMFNEMRRTGYPDVPLGSRILTYNRTNGKFISRLGYPAISLANNNAGYRTAILDQKGDVANMSNMTLPVWWSGEAISIDKGAPWPHAFRTPPHKYTEDEY